MTGDKVAEESQSSIGEFLGFITIFLGTFAVIAVIVGGFIIANTFSILVAQRVRELALLRALGASRTQVRRSVLIEAALMALLGSTLGLFVGLGLARGLAALFGTFGLEINASVLNLTPTTIVTAYAVGVLVTVISAYLPARRAAKVAPVAAMRDDVAMSEGSLRRRTIIGAVLLVVGAGGGSSRGRRRPGQRRGLHRRRRGDLGADRGRDRGGARPAGAGRLPQPVHPRSSAPPADWPATTRSATRGVPAPPPRR